MEELRLTKGIEKVLAYSFFILRPFSVAEDETTPGAVPDGHAPPLTGRNAPEYQTNFPPSAQNYIMPVNMSSYFTMLSSHCVYNILSCPNLSTVSCKARQERDMMMSASTHG
jgi:hypothetical protein